MAFNVNIVTTFRNRINFHSVSASNLFDLIKSITSCSAVQKCCGKTVSCRSRINRTNLESAKLFCLLFRDEQRASSIHCNNNIPNPASSSTAAALIALSSVCGSKKPGSFQKLKAGRNPRSRIEQERNRTILCNRESSKVSIFRYLELKESMSEDRIASAARSISPAER